MSWASEPLHEGDLCHRQPRICGMPGQANTNSDAETNTDSNANENANARPGPSLCHAKLCQDQARYGQADARSCHSVSTAVAPPCGTQPERRRRSQGFSSITRDATSPSRPSTPLLDAKVGAVVAAASAGFDGGRSCCGAPRDRGVAAAADAAPSLSPPPPSCPPPPLPPRKPRATAALRCARRRAPAASSARPLLAGYGVRIGTAPAGPAGGLGGAAPRARPPPAVKGGAPRHRGRAEGRRPAAVERQHGRVARWVGAANGGVRARGSRRGGDVRGTAGEQCIRVASPADLDGKLPVCLSRPLLGRQVAARASTE
eukprot:198848-Chlamydomonas_euryale.AAC.3